MAGIGFELKKIFNKNTISSHIKGFSYASFVSVGPMIISVVMLIIIGRILKHEEVSIKDRELVNVAIMYAYIFAMINVSGYVMLASRYIADKLFIEDLKDVLASLVGVIAISTFTGGLIALGFYIRSPLPLDFKLLSYMLFLELSILYILIAYVSAVKDYKKVAYSFALGVLITIVSSIVLNLLGVNIILAVLLGIDFGFFITITILLAVIKRFFGVLSNKIFDFLKYIYKMPMLFFVNIFYTLGLFVHSFIFWKFSDVSISLNDTYLAAPTYDMATFFAVLTILPSIVLFVVKVETSFYEKYKSFCQAIVNGGSLRDLQIAKVNMVEVIRREISYIIEVQFILTFLLIIIGVNVVLPLMGSSSQTIELFTFLAIGYFLTYITFIIVTILLYFDNQEAAFKITGFFLLSNTLLTYISIQLGDDYYGLGLCASALLSLVISMQLLNNTLHQIDYRLFCKQPFSIKKGKVKKGGLS